MSIFHFVYLGVTMWSAVAGVAGILAGVTLVTGQRSGRVIAIVAALVSVSELPIGIALGVYTLAVLLPAPPTAPYAGAATRP
jgi:hypothetical protein